MNLELFNSSDDNNSPKRTEKFPMTMTLSLIPLKKSFLEISQTNISLTGS